MPSCSRTPTNTWSDGSKTMWAGVETGSARSWGPEDALRSAESTRVASADDQEDVTSSPPEPKLQVAVRLLPQLVPGSDAAERADEKPISGAEELPQVVADMPRAGRSIDEPERFESLHRAPGREALLKGFGALSRLTELAAYNIDRHRIRLLQMSTD